jgi:putative DNA primase/helicase
LLLFRDELSGWLATMDREGHENDRSFYCESWNGTGAYTYDRIGRGTVRIGAACLSVLGGIQPGPLQAYLHEVFGRGATDDGMIQRFQLTVYPDVAGEWVNVDRWPDSEAKNAVFAVFRQLAELDIVLLGATQGDGLPYLRFTAEAQAVFDVWRADLERRLRADTDHPVVISHLAKYRSLMPALALILHVVDCLDMRTGGPVSEQAARRAVAWCTYLEAHARRVYQTITALTITTATLLAAKLSRGELPSPFRARTVLRKGWTGLSDMEAIDLALDLLEELYWVRRVDVPATVKGGRPTAEYLVNPTVTATEPPPGGSVGSVSGSPGEYALARGRHVEETSSSSSSENLHTPTPSHRQNRHNPHLGAKRGGATSTGLSLAERVRAVRERAQAQRAPRR